MLRQGSMTYEQVKSYIESTGYILLSKDYINASLKLEIQCDKGHVYTASMSKFKMGRRCPHCARNVKLTYEHVKTLIETYNCELISPEYKSTKNKLIIKCCICGLIFNKTFEDVIRLKSNTTICPICRAPDNRLTHEYVFKFAKTRGYELLSKYKNTRGKISLKCPKGHLFEMRCTSFLHENKGCPVCCRSKGETKIALFLDSNNIDYVQERSFKDCLSVKNRKLRFDFYIPALNTCIEFDGAQHSRFVTFGSHDYAKREADYELLKKNDEIKNKYCHDNNIILIRISSKEYKHIDEILSKLILGQ